MKRLLKILKKKIKQIGILSIISISSFLLFNITKTKALLTTEENVNYIYLDYDFEYINEIVNNDSFNNAINSIMDKFEEGGYFHYIIYVKQNTLYAIFTYDYLDFRLIKENDTLNFDLIMNNHYRVLTYKNSNGTFVYHNDTFGINTNSNIVYNISSSATDFDNNYSSYDPTFFIYESDIPNVIYLWDESYATFYDLNSNKLIEHGTSIPKYNEYKPNINFKTTSNTIIVDDKEYINSKNVTITFNTYDYENYFYIYKLEDSNNWISYMPTQAETNINLNVSENTNVIAQVLDRNTSEVVTTASYAISDINQYTGLTLRKTYNSGTNGNDLHSLNIINYDSTYDINFKIQFGPNDFDGSHTPYITQINAYAYNTQTQQKINTSAVYIDDFTCYKEIEGDVETWCTGTLKTDMNSPSYYEIIFANTDNYYLYYYDNYVLDDRKIDITTNLFKDYNKYYFNMNSDKAYINLKSINQSNKEGSIIIPYYYLNNDELDIKVRKYNSSIGDFETNYNSYPFIDNYYHKIDFEISDTYYPIITNKKGRYCTTYYTNEEELYNFVEQYKNWGFIAKIGSIPYLMVKDGTQVDYLLETEVECYQEEEVYFYVHKDFKVTFGEIGSSDDVYIYDDNFNVIDKVDKDFNNTSPYTGNETFFDSVKNSINYFSAPIREILNMISYLWSGLNPIIQYFIIFIFMFLIGLFVFKFLL